mmetsp:Transcript_45512/g.74158  ORF Transcript_45512/g.74158 Transcript_45512/m.74158 type:complete len:293 (+) Transcript_45512:66-944(+)
MTSPLEKFLVCTKGHEGSCVFGHRGESEECPQNSLAAIRKAHENGACGVEFDVRLTSDFVPCLRHDDDLSTTSDAIGLVSKSTWEVVSKIDISVKHKNAEQYRGELVPHFHDALLLAAKELGMRVLVDVKADPLVITGARKLAQLICDFIKQHDLYEQVLVCSFFFPVLYFVGQLDPKVVQAPIWFHFERSKFYNFFGLKGVVGGYLVDFANRNILYHVLKIRAISCEKSMLTDEFITYWRDQKKIALMAWTVNTPADKARFSRLNIPIITDSTRKIDQETIVASSSGPVIT